MTRVSLEVIVVSMATSRRARQIIGGDEPYVEGSTDRKPLSIAVDELNQAKIKIISDEED